MAAARAYVERVAATCTRFDQGSDLMRANRSGHEVVAVDPVCAEAIARAHSAHLMTGGLFDPRVDLTTLGYARSWQGSTAASSLAPVGAVRRPGGWHPHLEHDRVSVGPDPLDLGGIGKGFAVAGAARILAGHGRSVLVEAGGDLQVVGTGPDGAGWLVGVEDPHGGPDPVAVLRLSDTGCATSSTRVRRWTRAGAPLHHVVDPRTGTSANGGLAAVTVVHPDAATAEVWAKSLLVAGAAAAPELAARHRLAALWVRDDGARGRTRETDHLVVWEADRAA
jgi:thiamine biosynthesis lipoprotein